MTEGLDPYNAEGCQNCNHARLPHRDGTGPCLRCGDYVGGDPTEAYATSTCQAFVGEGQRDG